MENCLWLFCLIFQPNADGFKLKTSHFEALESVFKVTHIVLKSIHISLKYKAKPIYRSGSQCPKVVSWRLSLQRCNEPIATLQRRPSWDNFWTPSSLCPVPPKIAFQFWGQKSQLNCHLHPGLLRELMGGDECRWRYLLSCSHRGSHQDLYGTIFWP